jgi:predicted Zn-dependent peptidase
MRKAFIWGSIALSISLSVNTAAFAEPAPGSAAVQPLIQKVRIPYERFTLSNGLTVIVHTDRKAPVVAVSVWYGVGSKNEPKGKTGFAHLFEHLMFNGSENADGDWFEPMAQIGATNLNGSTWYDRTNYFETVPTGALERTLYLESDRMGHLLGAVTQKKLSNQIGVVQNEKRQGDNKPFGLVEYAETDALFPASHPYGHTTIGSMADLSTTSLADVKQWFHDHYGPNNVVLVLAGDINAATARTLVQRYFGDISRGPATRPFAAPVPTLKSPKFVTLHDQIPTTRLYRTWVVPGLNDPDTVFLSMGAEVLGGLASSRLDNALVRDEQLAVRVTADVQSFAQMSEFEVTADVKAGVNPAIVSGRLDDLISELIAKGPTPAELKRVVVGETLQTVARLETAGGKAATLAEGELYSRDPNHFAKDLSVMAGATPSQVQRALQKWLRRPVLALSVAPGPRDNYAEAPLVPVVSAAANPGSEPKLVKRGALPDVGQLSELTFPEVTHGKLSNGIPITYAQRTAAPLTQISLSFDAGFAADPKGKLGMAQLTSVLLKEGTSTLLSKQIAEREEELGASIRSASSMDRTSVSLATLSSTIDPALKLMADLVKRPAFADREVDRLRNQQVARIASEESDPAALAARVLAPALYGERSIYGVPGTGSGTVDTVKTLTRSDIALFHSSWIRPEKAKLFVVSDLPLAKLQPLLEAQFGKWIPTGTPGQKRFVASPAAKSRILLADRKDSPQSQIVAAQLLAVDPKAELLPLEAANEVVGGSFLSRINMDIRETKGWSYGVRAGVGRREHAVMYQVSAPVQADKTGEAIASLIADYREFLTNKGVSAAELQRNVNNDIHELPGAFETSGSVLGALQANDFFGRPDDYYERLPAEYRQLTSDDLDAAARQVIDPTRFLWVVVGDAGKIKPQLDRLGIPIEQVSGN